MKYNLGLALLATAGFLRADPMLTLEGFPSDFPFLSPIACCIDVAASNLLANLGLLNGDPGTFQTNFHNIWDPQHNKDSGGIDDLVKGLKATVPARFIVVPFYTKDLTYETLLSEFTSGERIILLMKEIDKGYGHAVFLWGVDLDPNTPKVSVVDPNVHPNAGEPNANSGTSTVANLTIGKDSNNLPMWTIQYSSPQFQFDDTVFDREDFNYRIVGFVSVSDTPEPGTALLCLSALLWCVARGVARARR